MGLKCPEHFAAVLPCFILTWLEETGNDKAANLLAGLAPRRHIWVSSSSAASLRDSGSLPGCIHPCCNSAPPLPIHPFLATLWQPAHASQHCHAIPRCACAMSSPNVSACLQWPSPCFTINVFPSPVPAGRCFGSITCV